MAEEVVEDAVAVVAVEENQEDKEAEDQEKEKEKVGQEEGHQVLEVVKVRAALVKAKVLVAVEVALIILEVVNQKLTGIKTRKLNVL